jgi:hypothetical protein
MEGAASKSGPAFKASKCSSFPTQRGVTTSQDIGLAQSQATDASSFNVRQSVLYIAVSNARTSIILAAPKRGPPTVSN